ncbi:hypothetical protein L6475_01930 [Prevotella sp. E9-3]|uniref:hypothetical protein n=1 Tax=Prevotella sp. E9-3 TaxID=2913621 RepID=UPI001EDA1D94|nr:hypothetical protein [Prevotella sp. E9-3]UKK48753.1 hypothetical protein L6475_01930 [Prevotella sp. E9-3]
MLQKIEPLAHLLLTPSQIGDLLGLSGEDVAELQNPYKEAGKMYRRVLAERALELHEKTLRLADIGSPTAIDEANQWLRTAQISIE